MADQALSELEWRRVCVDIASCAGETLTKQEQTCLRAFWITFSPGGDGLRAATCTLGPESMALMPDATVTPCRRLPVPVGNALNEPFADILERLAQYRPAPAGGCAALARVQQEWNEQPGSA